MVTSLIQTFVGFFDFFILILMTHFPLQTIICPRLTQSMKNDAVQKVAQYHTRGNYTAYPLHMPIINPIDTHGGNQPY